MADVGSGPTLDWSTILFREPVPNWVGLDPNSRMVQALIAQLTGNVPFDPPPPGPPILLGTPEVSGGTAVGDVLTSSTGVWLGGQDEPTSFTYAWQRDGAPISGATNATYTLVTADEGHSIGCIVTAVNAIGSTVAPLSNTIVVPAPPAAPVNTAAPQITGTAAVGDVLTCSTGTWTGAPTAYHYAWESNGVAVGTDANTYTVASGDAGHDITCVVTAVNAGGSTASPVSNAIAIPA